MQHLDLIQRAFRIVWRHKVLWLFGFLLALTSGGGGGGTGYNFSRNEFDGAMSGLPSFPNFNPDIILPIVLVCCCLLLILIVVSTIVQYVAKAALFRMVDQIEVGDRAPTWREGFRLGWSRRTFRLFLLEFVIGLLVFVAVLVLLLLAASPLLLLATENNLARGIGIAGAVMLFLVFLLIAIVGGTILGVLLQFWGREVVLADRGFGDAIASGNAMVRRRAKDVFLMWLLMFAIGIGFAIVMFLVTIVALLVAGAIGAGLGFLLYRLTDSWAWALGVGLPPFLLLLIVPVSIVTGVYMAFQSGVWTLTYRDVAAPVAEGQS
jgi:hypothetical protein